MKMKSILESIEKKKIVSLYDNKNDTAGHYSGDIQYVNEDHVLISHYNSSGGYSGYVLLKTENIYRVDQDGKYENSLKRLSKLQSEEQAHHCFNETEDLVFDLLQFAQQKQLVVLIELCESDMDDIQGFILNINKETVVISCIDNFGEQDGISTIFTEDISVIKCDTNPCREAKLLYDCITREQRTKQ